MLLPCQVAFWDLGESVTLALLRRMDKHLGDALGSDGVLASVLGEDGTDVYRRRPTEDDDDDKENSLDGDHDKIYPDQLDKYALLVLLAAWLPMVNRYAGIFGGGFLIVWLVLCLFEGLWPFFKGIRQQVGGMSKQTGGIRLEPVGDNGPVEGLETQSEGLNNQPEGLNDQSEALFELSNDLLGFFKAVWQWIRRRFQNVKDLYNKFRPLTKEEKKELESQRRIDMIERQREAANKEGGVLVHTTRPRRRR
ncbi:hypothetical protein QBC36DRAFT_313485 [Triangularia setosa]|uniref:Uncharacterized protein n=1 Tax=Triangularia setosa TaxID=2587417 RepID=A0AAN7A4L4_9PEZI|nr:hypothetical protein QBC36DRAFT_313485 [Podospora setosa]